MRWPPPSSAREARPPIRDRPADARAIAETSARIKREAGTPDILINNAGAGRWLSVLETSAEEAHAMIEVPYLAAFNLTRAFLPKMIARGCGAIACVTSPASYVVWPNAAAYIAARHAMLGFTESLRADLRRTGIDVTLVVLGAVETAYWQHNPGSRERLPEANSILAPIMTAERRRKRSCMAWSAATPRGQACDPSRAVRAECVRAGPCRAAASPRGEEAISG